MFKRIRTAVLFLGALFALSAWAQPGPDDQADQPDPPSRVARLAFVRGAVSFVPAGENDWVEAQLNRPLITGDKLWTDHDSRAELEIGASAIRIDQETSFDFLNLDDQTAQVELTQGALNLRIRRLYDGQTYEVDTPTLAFVADRVGEYRVTVNPDGQSTSIAVLHGAGDAYGEGGARFRIEEGQFVTFNDSQLQDYYTDALPPPDDFDEFIAQRDARWDRARSREYVSEDVIGYQDLDDYGDWDDVPDYGNVWYPTSVAVGWTPYHYGHWGWVGVYGWTWIDDAPWGFAPFHYGRWAYIRGRWGWCPGPRAVRPYYAPALVAFIGGGVSVSVGGPVGWFPLGPHDVYFPGYHVSRRYFRDVNVSNTVVNVTVVNNYYGHFSRGDINYADVHFHNRGVAGAVTAVPAAAFVNARPVRQAAIAVNRQTFANARVSAFAAVAPTRASLVATSARVARTPPRAAFDRRIVAASKPPPPVAPFAAREALLQKNPGRPLGMREIHALPAVQNNARSATVSERANVKVVTHAGAPVRSPAAPLARRTNPNAAATQRTTGAERRGPVNVPPTSRETLDANARGNAGAGNDGRAVGNGRGQGAGNERLRSSGFVHGNENKVESGNNARRVEGRPVAPPPVANPQQPTGERRYNPAAAANRSNANANEAEQGRGNANGREYRSERGQGAKPSNAQQYERVQQPQHVERVQQPQRVERVEQAPQRRIEQAPVQQRTYQAPVQQQRTYQPPPPPPPRPQYQRAQPQPQVQRGQSQERGNNNNEHRGDNRNKDDKGGGRSH